MSVKQIDWLFVVLSLAAWFFGLVYYSTFATHSTHLTVLKFIMLWLFGSIPVGALNFALTAVAGAITVSMTGDVEGHRAPLVATGLVGTVLSVVLARLVLLAMAW